MVYSSEILDASFDAQNTSTTPKPAVEVKWNGKGIHELAGPTPFVDISYNTERNAAGGAEVLVTKITLTGKIVRTGNPGTLTSFGSGVTPVVTGINQIKSLFTDNDFGVLSITCGGAPSSNQPPGQIFAVTGVRVMSMDFSKTDDNWVTTCDYTIILEANESAISGFSVKGTVDSWNIEPLEEYTYSYFSPTITQKQEYHNPKLKPTVPTAAAPQPTSSSSAGNGDGATKTANVALSVLSIPQFKISHTVSAIGVPSGSGNDAQYSVYMNAKKWVDYRLSYGISTYTRYPGQTATAPVTGLVNIGPGGASSNPPSIWPHLGSGYLYNHLRSVNFSITEAKYEVVDTWLAMPTGIRYFEDYSIEMSTDEKYIHTVRVQGEVKGLSIAAAPALTGASGPIDANQASTRINLSYGTGIASGSLNQNQKIFDNMGQDSDDRNNFYGTKYENANSGWLNDIKPYLYRRACLVMNSKDRDRPYVSPATTPQPPPGNPIFSTLGLLNIVPVSTSEGHDPRKGTISYSYEFNNKFTIISGVISENITMNDTGPTDVIGEAFVLGRALGPVLQNLGTKTSSEKEVSIEVTVVPPSSLKGFFMQNSDCPLWTGGTVYTTITGIIEGLKPFGDRPTAMFGTPTFSSRPPINARGQVFVKGDNHVWEPTNGRFVRTVRWTYQQCANDKNWMDH